MHFRMLATTSMPVGTSSEDARISVLDALLNDDSFCGTGGRFGSSLCDWFEIGGRWSGLLAEASMGDMYRNAVVVQFPDMAKGWWPESLVDAHREELDAIWREHGGAGSSPYTRNDRSEIGYPDDAMLITSKLYDSLLSTYEGQSIVADRSHCEFVDLDGDPLRPDAIGRKWVVVIDYHN